MVVNVEWAPDLVVKYIISGQLPDAKKKERECYEIKFEFKRFDYYLILPMDPESKVPMQPDLVLGGLGIYKRTLMLQIVGVCWHKIVELASRYQDKKEIRKIDSGRNAEELQSEPMYGIPPYQGVLSMIRENLNDIDGRS